MKTILLATHIASRYDPAIDRTRHLTTFPGTSDPMSENGRQRLTSWKEIGTHLGRDVRTVLRWEKERGLPVHRVPGATGRVVFAYKDELESWGAGEAKVASDTVSPASQCTGAVVGRRDAVEDMGASYAHGV